MLEISISILFSPSYLPPFLLSLFISTSPFLPLSFPFHLSYSPPPPQLSSPSLSVIGCVKVVDVETCSQVHSITGLGHVNSLSVSYTGTRPSVGVAHAGSSLSVFAVDEVGSWKRNNVLLGDTSTQVSETIYIIYVS